MSSSKIANIQSQVKTITSKLSEIDHVTSPRVTRGNLAATCNAISDFKSSAKDLALENLDFDWFSALAQ